MSEESDATQLVDATALRAQHRVGATLRGKWHLDRLLGVGGMAGVYAATHRNGSRGAIKILHTELSIHGHVRSRFLKEGYVANRVDHPGAVQVLDDDTAEDGSLFLVMELLDGESLEQRRERRGGRLDAAEVLSVADQLLDVLAAAHAKGIIHRDIKPDNVFLTRDGIVKVLDFGIARMRELSTASQATQAGSTLGTPAYMSPEHARGLWDEVDARSDLWSVGATLYHLLTGELVHQGRTTNEELLAAMSSRAPPIASVVPDISRFVAEIVDKSLAFEKADRYPDASAMQDAVRRAFHAMHGAPITSRPLLGVPASVPNRTLPSADPAAPMPLAAATTGGAVSAGRTGVSLRSLTSAPRSVFVAVGGALVVGVVLVIVVVALVHGHGSAAVASGGVAGSAAPAAAVEPTAAAPASVTVAPAVSMTAPSVDDPVPLSALPEMSAPPPVRKAPGMPQRKARRPSAAPPPPAPKRPTPKPGLLPQRNW